MVCSMIEVRFESALYSWVDNLMLIVLGILSLPKSIKEYNELKVLAACKIC